MHKLAPRKIATQDHHAGSQEKLDAICWQEGCVGCRFTMYIGKQAPAVENIFTDCLDNEDLILVYLVYAKRILDCCFAVYGCGTHNSFTASIAANIP